MHTTSNERALSTTRAAAIRLILAAAALAITTTAPAGETEGESKWWLSEHAGCLHGKLEYADISEKAWDEDTGEDRRNFPPSRVVDYGHMRLDMHFEDLNDMRFTATEELSFIPIGKPTTTLTLNAVGLEVESVTLDGDDVAHYQDDETITLTFDDPLPVGREQTVTFEYICDHPYDGMFFTPYSPDAPDYTAEVHTQGQTESNRHWFIAHDFPNAQMTTELRVNVPAGYQVSSNGRLVSHDKRDSRAVWHYLQDKPHVSYLVSLIIGKFDIVELDHPRVPMKVWVPRGLGHQVEQTYGNTGAMLDLFEQRLGVAYPWDRYDQLVVKNFGAGGMENTSVTTMYPTAIFDKTQLLDRDLDGLIAHELAHQWTGDLITCKSWEHIWLNEGWATYLTAIWFEQRDGEVGYLDSMRRNFGVAWRDDTDNELPMVSPIYENSWETFRRRANPYPKGASILHMLRKKLGDDLFWKGVQLYMNRHAYDVVETHDFRYALEEASGLSLEHFFEQWCYRPGTPDLDVTVDYDPRSSELIVDIEQAQHIDARTPAFEFDLPIHVETAGGAKTYTVHVEQQSTTYRTKLDSAPQQVAIDPHLHVLKTIDVDKPQTMWRRQAMHGPTIVARHEAVQALGDEETPRNRELIVSIVGNPDERYTLRNTAVRSLSGYGSAPAKDEILRLLDEGIDESRVRSTLINTLRDFEADRVVERLARYADKDESYACRVAAVRGLAAHEAKDHADLIAELVHFESQHDQVRNAALDALAELEDERGLKLAMDYARYGNMDRSRPDAIEVIGKLAHHDHDAAVEYLIGLLDDPEPRSRRSAMAALADLGDERAEELLEAIADSDPDPRMRERAERYLERLRENMEDEGDSEG